MEREKILAFLIKQNANVDEIRAPTIYFIESRYLAGAK